MLTLPPEIDVTVLTGTNGVEGSVDMRFFPLTIEKKVGEPSEEYVRNFYKWRKACSAYAHSIGTCHVNIMNIDEWGVPKPTIRRLIGELSSDDKDEVGFAWQFIVVNKPVIRGAVTAIVWMRGDQSVYSFVADWADGIRNALELFRQRGIELPPINDSYVMPTNEAERRRKK